MKRIHLLTIYILLCLTTCSFASPRLFVIPQPDSLAEHALILSMQGLIAKDSPDRIWVDRGDAWFDWLSLIEKKHGYSIVHVSAQAGSFTNLAQQIAKECSDSYDGYILCDIANQPDSLFVALSLAGPLRKIVVDASIRDEFLQGMGIGGMVDVRKMGIETLLHEYADKLNWEGISYPNTYERISSADWCVLNNWPIFYTSDRNTAEKFMERTRPNAMAISWNPPYAVTGTGAQEDKFISYFSQRGLSVIPGVLMHNLSTLSGIARVTEQNPLRQELPKHYQVDENKHYVAFFLNSGGNLGYLHGRYLMKNNRGERSNWMNKSHDFPVSLSMSLAAVDFSPFVLRTLYGLKSEQDCFVTPFSGHSYMHPSQYRYLDQFVEQLNHYLTLADQRIVGIQENKDVETDQNWIMDYGSKFLEAPAVKGLFVMNKPWGKILWHNGKPAITKRYGMRVDGDEQAISRLAGNLNAQSADIHNENGYSIIHVDLEKTSFEDLQQLVDQLAPHIQVVHLEELVYHVTHHVTR